MGRYPVSISTPIPLKERGTIFNCIMADKTYNIKFKLDCRRKIGEPNQANNSKQPSHAKRMDGQLKIWVGKTVISSMFRVVVATATIGRNIILNPHDRELQWDDRSIAASSHFMQSRLLKMTP